ncbi:Protein PIN-likeS 2 [Vitis vinifera]|uniref:Protein PIN-likeS 2 n=1 Tax=Vitis vinifera TaxID=29760 RepID=A0A438BL75_VITVI|nr:Protein PIN-likeS 2 [Vitis vinifera]
MSKATFKLLSKLVFVLFLLCLIFTQLGQSITGKNFVLWWFIPVNVIICTAVGCILRYLVAIICQPPHVFFRFTIIMTAFRNTGNLSLAIVGSVCHSAKNPFGLDCHTSGVFYVSFAQWVVVILEYYEIVEEGNKVKEVVTANDLSRLLLVEAEWPGMEDKETKHCPNSLESITCLVEPKVVRRIRIVAEQTPIQHILQPPIVASLLAIIIGMFPQLKSFLFDYDAPLSFITDSLSMLAGATIPFVLLILEECLLRMNFFGSRGSNVRVYAFVAIYNTNAILLGAIASLRGYAVSEASTLLLAAGCTFRGEECEFRGQQMCSETAGSLDEHGKKTVGWVLKAWVSFS